jgi:hypothetical protein
MEFELDSTYEDEVYAALRDDHLPDMHKLPSPHHAGARSEEKSISTSGGVTTAYKVSNNHGVSLMSQDRPSTLFIDAQSSVNVAETSSNTQPLTSSSHAIHDATPEHTLMNEAVILNEMTTPDPKLTASATSTTANAAVVVATLRWLMTGTLALLASAAILSLWAATQYRLLLLVGWMIVGFLFVGFCLVLQDTVLDAGGRKRRRRVFHPVVHAMADWVVLGVTDFLDDCRDEYQRLLLLSNSDSSKTGDEMNTTTGDEERKKPRSRLFRVMVQPLFQLRMRRQRRRQEKRQKKESVAVPTHGSATYIPPPHPPLPSDASDAPLSNGLL